jgi:transposase
VDAADRAEFLRVACGGRCSSQEGCKRIALCSWTSAPPTPSLHRFTLGRLKSNVRCKITCNYGPNVTLFASMTHEGMGPCLAVKDATTRELFEIYIEQMLGPALRVGQVVVMDNLSPHKGQSVRELIEERGCELLYLPPYSPDFNPIEEAFAKVKALLRRAAAGSREALVETIGAALEAITAQDTHGFFGHCGYGAPIQPL